MRLHSGRPRERADALQPGLLGLDLGIGEGFDKLRELIADPGQRLICELAQVRLVHEFDGSGGHTRKLGIGLLVGLGLSCRISGVADQQRLYCRALLLLSLVRVLCVLREVRLLVLERFFRGLFVTLFYLAIAAEVVQEIGELRTLMLVIDLRSMPSPFFFGTS